MNISELIGVPEYGHLGGVALDVEREGGIFIEDHSENGMLEDDVPSRLLSFFFASCTSTDVLRLIASR